MLRTLVVLLALTSLALASVSLEPLQPKPGKFKDVEGCYIDDLDEVLPFGQSAPCKKHCMEYRCRANSVEVAMCGSASAVPPCKVVEDHSKPFPDCCPRAVC